MNNSKDWLVGVAAAVGVVAVVGIIFWCIYAVTVANNKEKEALVVACVSSGGSWVMDGYVGECWQPGMFSTGESD